MVSVVVPNYNHGPFLKRRIDSVLQQSFQDYEIIILDDCSTDNSREIIESYRGHPKVSGIVYNSENSGSPFRQWTKGLQLAKGDWVWIAESDDWCEHNFLETVMAGALKCGDCVIAYAQSFCVDDSGAVNWTSVYKGDSYVKGMQFFRERLVWGCTIFNGSMAIFKRSAAMQVPPVFTSFKQCGDWYFWIVLARQGNLYISNATLNYYRKVPQSLTSGNYNKGYHFVEELSMFALLQAEMPEERFLIDRSVFNRYNSFRRHTNKKEKFDKAVVKKAFHNYAGGKVPFYYFVAQQNVRLIIRKAFNRLQLLSCMRLLKHRE